MIDRSFDAALVLSSDALQPVESEVYRFSQQLALILKAAFHENKAFADAWSREPVTTYWEHEFSDRGSKPAKPAPAGLRLLHEALETWLIQRLSTHLTDYYNHLEDGKRNTVTFQREHAPSLLLENRILSLLSTPVSDRPVFLEGHGSGVTRSDSGSSKRVVYTQMGPGGALFERFELVLPKGSRLSRRPSGELTIDTPRLHLSLRAVHEGFNASLPFRFVSHYYGSESFRVSCLLVRVRLTGHVKPLGLLRRQGWDLYRWVDSFADSIEETASVERLLERIQWPTLDALLMAKEAKRNDSGKR